MIKRRKPRIYVSGPITSSGNLTDNVREGIRFGTCLLNDGYTPFVPHLSELWNYVSVVPYETWISYDKDWVRACDAVFRLPGKSKGAAREVRFANRMGIPVFRSYRKLSAWKEAFMNGPKSIIPKATKSSRSKPVGRGLSSRGKRTKKSA